jgi:hypothetical protein
MAKKKVSHIHHIHKVYRLVRSDNTLLMLGIFSVVLLLIGLYMYQTASTVKANKKGVEVERTYRVETAPAVINQPASVPTDVDEDEIMYPEDSQ